MCGALGSLIENDIEAMRADDYRHRAKSTGSR